MPNKPTKRRVSFTDKNGHTESFEAAVYKPSSRPVHIPVTIRAEGRSCPIVDDDPADCDEESEGRYASHGFYKYPREWMFINSISDKAIKLLVFLTDLSRRVRAVKRYDGWFYCTVEKVEREIGMERTAQGRCLKELVDSDLIEMTKKGMPSKRHVRIRWSTLRRVSATVDAVVGLHDSETEDE